MQLCTTGDPADGKHRGAARLLPGGQRRDEEERDWPDEGFTALDLNFF